MDEKTAFIAECLRGELPVTALCERYGISRDTGYRLLGRYREEGPSGLEPRSRAPHRHGMTMAEEVAAAITALRGRRPYWGPKKLRAVLQRENPKQRWPAPSTIGDLLRRQGLSEPRRRRRRAVPLTQPFMPVHEPNDLWCIDFKSLPLARTGGLVPHSGRAALRSTDDHRCRQPVSDRVPHCS